MKTALPILALLCLFGSLAAQTDEPRHAPSPERISLFQVPFT